MNKVLRFGRRVQHDLFRHIATAGLLTAALGLGALPSPAAAATGDGSMTITEAVGPNEPGEAQPLAVLFPATDADGYPWFPDSNTTATCLHQESLGLSATLNPALPCASSAPDLGSRSNNNGIADRVVVDGYVLVPDGATQIELQFSNLRPNGAFYSGAIHLYANTAGAERAAMTYLDGGGVTETSELLAMSGPITIDGGATGCAVIPAIAYRAYVFDGHAGMSVLGRWNVSGGAADTAGAFTDIPATYLASLTGYVDDLDSDGTADYLQLDTDGDGLTDLVEGYADADTDGAADCADRPEAAGDDSSDNVSGAAVTLDVAANDAGPNLDPSSVAIVGADDQTGDLVVVDQGTWSVTAGSGEISFIPVVGFVGDPTPIEYVIFDSLGAQAAPVVVSISYLDPVDPIETTVPTETTETTVPTETTDPGAPSTTVVVDPASPDAPTTTAQAVNQSPAASQPTTSASLPTTGASSDIPVVAGLSLIVGGASLVLLAWRRAGVGEARG